MITSRNGSMHTATTPIALLAVAAHYVSLDDLRKYILS